MLGWAMTFLIVALIAAVLGFGGIAGPVDRDRKDHLLRCDRSIRDLGVIRPDPWPVADRPVGFAVTFSGRSRRSRSATARARTFYRLVFGGLGVRAVARRRPESAAPARGENGAGGVIGAEVVGTVDGQQLASRVRARLTRLLMVPTAQPQIVGGLLVGEARCADQDQRLALVRRQLGERRAEFLELDVAGLLRMGLQRLGIAAVGILDLAPALAVFRAEQVAQDREQPGGMLVPGWNELMLASARSSVSCTRSSARSTLPLSEMANARRLGTAARIASRTDG